MSTRPGRPRKQAGYEASVLDSTYDVVDQVYYQSNGQLRLTGEIVNVRPTKQSSKPSKSDRYSNWKPLSKSLQKGNTTTLDALLLDESDDEEEGAEESQKDGKRKRYASSDDPNRIWRLHAMELLHELYRFDGPGDALSNPCCVTCGALPKAAPAPRLRLFKCQDCHPLLECMDCCLERHRMSPLHRIKEWNGTFYEQVSLQALGLVYQVGHGGLPCLSPEPTVRTMVVLDHTGLHTISYQYCACVPTHAPTNVQQLMRAGWYPATTTDPRTCATFNVLDLYRALNVIANVNVDDFVKTLIAQTNATRTTTLPERYKTFSRMARQWAFLHRIKRSGVGLSLIQIADIQPGSLAVVCWACPRPDVNLAPGWDSPQSKFSYLYMPVLALDANFRLRNRLRTNERPDPALSPGSAYFVDPVAYKEHLKNYISEEDISTCVAFSALLEKDTKLTTGLKTSGVAGCACARHEVVRPQGIGDLQKGERYANMDFVFFSAIQGYNLPRLAVSYDIVCQWRRKFWERMDNLPPDLQLDKAKVQVSFGLPTWHAVAHEITCRTKNALTYQEGLGRTDGEGIERIWSRLNSASYATKEMGEGTRHDSLDDRIDYLNFSKNLSLGDILARRLIVATEERDRQIASFTTVDSQLNPATRAEWLARITAWKADSSLTSPYLITAAAKGPSEDDIRKELKAKEKQEAALLKSVIHSTSASGFLDAGLQLEDIQLKLHRDAQSKNLTQTERSKLEERRCAFFKQLEAFRELQHIWTPGAAVMLASETSSPTTPPQTAENTTLYLPSDFPHDKRVIACAPQLTDMEIRLREGRCNDALVTLRHYLHAKRGLLSFRNANVAGQNDSTRARGLIDTVGDRVEMEADKYRRSRQALLNLKNVTSLGEYPELKKADVALEKVDDEDLLAMERLGAAGSKSHRRDHVSTGKTTTSWVWTGAGGPTPEEGGVDEASRIEWSKALARKDRWCEEVEWLNEEMKQVRRCLDWQADWWKQQMPILDEKSLQHPAAAIAAGMRAYAAKQANVFCTIEKSFAKKWA